MTVDTHQTLDAQQSQAEEAFFELVGRLTEDDPATRAQLLPGLRRRLEAPPTALLNAVLQHQRLSDEQARRLLFAPSSSDMAAVYPTLLVGDPTAPADLSHNAANRAQVVALSHMYLVHGRLWPRMRPFIEAGGLRQLVLLLAHANRVLASQALQLLLLATHPADYDWHNPPSSSSSSSSDGPSQRAGGPAPMRGPDARLWLQLAQLAHGPLLGALLRLSPDVWPGSGQQAMQLLDFMLPWLATWWCKAPSTDAPALQLSPALLAGLAAWSRRLTATQEERHTAAQLLREFGGAGAAAAAPCAESAGAVAVAFEPAEELVVVADRTQINSGPGSEAERLRAAGNDAFRARDWAAAIRCYSDALDVAVPAEALLSEAPRRAAYHANRAAAYLERAWQLRGAAAAAAGGGGDEHGAPSSSSSSRREEGGLLDGLLLDGGAESIMQQLQAAVMDCRSALELAPCHAKAHFRLASGLEAQGKLADALAAAAAAQQYATTAADKAAAGRLAARIKQRPPAVPVVVSKPLTTAAAGCRQAASIRISTAPDEDSSSLHELQLPDQGSRQQQQQRLGKQAARPLVQVLASSEADDGDGSEQRGAAAAAATSADSSTDSDQAAKLLLEQLEVLD